MEMDEILERIGSYGWYQKRLTFLIILIEGINMCYQINIIVLIAAEPPWKCSTNATNCTVDGYFRPGMEHYFHRCNIPRDQWEFSKDFTSIVTEYDLVCEHTYLASLSSSMIFLGWFVGALIGGTIADKYGRKTIVIAFSFMISFWGLLIAFPKVFWFYVLARFLVGISRGCAGGSMFILLTEYVGVRHRHQPGTVMWYSWPVAIGIMSTVGYATRDWRILSIVLGVQGLPVLFAWWFLPESARYLIVKGRIGDCEKILRQIARVNKKEYPDVRLKDPTEGGKHEVRLGDFRDLFRSRSFTHKTLVTWVTWVANAVLLYSINLGVPDLGGNMYLTFFILGLPNIPGVSLSVWTMGRFGRRKSTAIPLVIACIAAFGTVLLTMFDPGGHTGYYIGRVLLVFAAKVVGNMSFNSIYVFSAELFPTTFRNVALGSGTAVARIGAFFSPFIAQSNRIHVVLPYGIMGVICLVAGILCMTLPETKGVPTAETIEATPENVNTNNLLLEEKPTNNLLLEEKPKQIGVVKNEEKNCLIREEDL